MTLKGSSFYVLLPSNTDVEGNKTNAFRVRLPRKLEFASEWMVGLAVLVYHHSWPSLGTSAPQFVRIRWRTKEELKIEIPAGSFKTPGQLLQTLNSLLNTSGRHDLVKRLEYYEPIIAKVEADAQMKTEQDIKAQYDTVSQRLNDTASATAATAAPTAPPPEISEKMRQHIYSKYFSESFMAVIPDVGEQKFIYNMLRLTNAKSLAPWMQAYKQVRSCCKFTYSEELQHFALSLNADFVECVELSEQLAYIMGFDRKTLTGSDSAKFIPDMTGGVSSFNVYAPGLIEPVMVGDITAPLLRMVNIHGSGLNEEVVEENYFAIQYHKLLVKEVSEIGIEIRTTSGTLMPFQYGTCTLTLHFKKSPYF